MAEEKIYPHIIVENNKKPNRFLAFPLIGIIAKGIILIPVFIEMVFLGFVAFFALIINWFIISITGQYWDSAYKLFLGIMRLEIKIRLYIWGITDKYPGFTFSTNNLFEFDIPKPANPNRWLATPIIGIIVRFILLIPYLIFADVLDRGSSVAMVISWFAVLFKGKFPESLYEFEKDTLRVSLASSAYMLGLSDKYPSFYISMNHQTVKILLILAGALLAFSNMGDFKQPAASDQSINRYQYNNSNYNYSPQKNINYNNY